jgi:hypothetical protein
MKNSSYFVIIPLLYVLAIVLFSPTLFALSTPFWYPLIPFLIGLAGLVVSIMFLRKSKLSLSSMLFVFIGLIVLTILSLSVYFYFKAHFNCVGPNCF